MICRALFLSGEDSFLQHKAGQLDQRAFDSYVAGVHFYMASPGIRAAWKVSAGQFGTDFREFVNSTLMRTPVAPTADAYSVWQNLLQAERSTPAA
jgi:hypothetical protein